MVVKLLFIGGNMDLNKRYKDLIECGFFIPSKEACKDIYEAIEVKQKTLMSIRESQIRTMKKGDLSKRGYSKFSEQFLFLVFKILYFIASLLFLVINKLTDRFILNERYVWAEQWYLYLKTFSEISSVTKKEYYLLSAKLVPAFAETHNLPEFCMDQFGTEFLKWIEDKKTFVTSWGTIEYLGEDRIRLTNHQKDFKFDLFDLMGDDWKKQYDENQ